MSKYSDKKKKQAELREQGFDVFAMYHGNDNYDDSATEESDSQEVQKKHKENPAWKHLDDKSESEIDEYYLKQQIDTFKQGPLDFYVTHQVNDEKRVFKVMAYDIEDARAKVKPLHLTGVYIWDKSQFKLKVPKDKLPPEIYGIADDHLQNIIATDVYKQCNIGLHEYVFWYNDSGNVCRFGRIRANEASEVYTKLKQFSIRPCKVYQQCENADKRSLTEQYTT